MFAKFKSLFSKAPTFPLLDTLEEVTESLLTSISCLDNTVKAAATPCFATFGNLQSADISAAMGALKSAYGKQGEVHCNVFATAHRMSSVYPRVRELHAQFQPERTANGIFLEQCDQMERDIATARKELSEMTSANAPDAHIALLQKKIEELKARQQEAKQKLKEVAPDYEAHFAVFQRSLLKELCGPLIETTASASEVVNNLAGLAQYFEQATSGINRNPPTDMIVTKLERFLSTIDGELEKMEQDETYYGDSILAERPE
jgi:chemotaxis protein histidine kinase CheA